MSLKSDMSFNDYVNVIKRKLTIVIIFFIIGFVITVSYALYLPPVYESTGTILIKSQQVQPNESGTKFAVEQFETLSKVVMSNEALVGLAKKYGLFGVDKNTALTSDKEIEVSKIMRLNTKVELLQVDSANWGVKNTIAFQVTANLNQPNNTYNVAKDLINLFMVENAKNTQSKVVETADFFEKVADAKKNSLEVIEREITEFKRTHANALPESVGVQTSSLDRLDSDLRASQREQSTAEAELRSLEISLESAKSGAENDFPSNDNSAESELDKLKAELAKESVIYNENHPSIRALQRKIQVLEDKGDATAVSKPKVNRAQSAMIVKIESQIAAAKSRIKSLDREQASIRDKINRTQGLVMQGAQSEGVLGALERKYESAKEEYNLAKAKYDSAKIDKNIQLENKGERLELIEAPVLPTSPIKPNRALLILLGLGASLLGAAGVAVLLEVLDGKVRGIDSIASIIKIQPIATIPYIKNQIDDVQVKYEFYNIAYVVFSVVVLLLIVVHFFVLPLDQVAAKMYSSF